jgi:hypothetical protein
VRAAAAARVTTRSGLPVLLVDGVVPPRRWCGTVARPTGLAGRSAVRLQLVTADEVGPGCPLTIDLYRDPDGRIDTVAAYRSRS